MRWCHSLTFLHRLVFQSLCGTFQSILHSRLSPRLHSPAIPYLPSHGHPNNKPRWHRKLAYKMFQIAITKVIDLIEKICTFIITVYVIQSWSISYASFVCWYFKNEQICTFTVYGSRNVHTVAADLISCLKSPLVSSTISLSSRLSLPWRFGLATVTDAAYHVLLSFSFILSAKSFMSLLTDVMIKLFERAELCCYLTFCVHISQGL